MNSRDCPFPGMDPWLERYWHPFHQAFVVHASDYLNDVLPDNYAASVEGRVFIDVPFEKNRETSPDILVTGRRVRASRPVGVAGLALAEPILVDMTGVEVTENYVEVIDLNADGRVVCVIELLSRSNKHIGKGRDLYAKKQRQTSASDAALMEIDLLRLGRPTTLMARQAGPLATYHACISTPWRRHVVEYYPIRLREPLPVLGVPLREGESPCPLDLQHVFAETYRRGRYDFKIDYSALPVPPLSDVDAASAKARLAEARPPAADPED